MASDAERALNRVAAVGLLIGAGLGLAGTLVTSVRVQASLWAIDSVALVIATTLLTLKYFRAGADLVSAGFLVFAIGEGVLLSGTAAGPRASDITWLGVDAAARQGIDPRASPARAPPAAIPLGRRRRLALIILLLFAQEILGGRPELGNWI